MSARLIMPAAGPPQGDRCETDGLPDHPHPHLRLARVAEAALDGAVKIEDQVRHLRTMKILAVEDIEDVQGRLGHDAADVELLRETEVERGELIVLPPEVALRDNSIRRALILIRPKRTGRETGIKATKLWCARILTGQRAVPDDRLRLRGAI